MQDLLQKKREFLASIVLLSDQVKDLQLYKKRLENSILLLNRQANIKHKEIEKMSQEIRDLYESTEKIKRDIDDWRRQEMEDVVEEVRKIREQGSI